MSATLRNTGSLPLTKTFIEMVWNNEMDAKPPRLWNIITSSYSCPIWRLKIVCACSWCSKSLMNIPSRRTGFNRLKSRTCWEICWKTTARWQYQFPMTWAGGSTDSTLQNLIIEQDFLDVVLEDWAQQNWPLPRKMVAALASSSVPQDTTESQCRRKWIQTGKCLSYG